MNGDQAAQLLLAATTHADVPCWQTDSTMPAATWADRTAKLHALVVIRQDAVRSAAQASCGALMLDTVVRHAQVIDRGPLVTVQLWWRIIGAAN